MDNIICYINKNLLEIIPIILMVIGGIFALIQWKAAVKVRRSEFLNEIMNKLLFDKEITEAMYKIEYDEEINNWYNEEFHGSDLEKEIDNFLLYICYILYLHGIGNINKEELKIINYEVSRIFYSPELEAYLWNLYHFSKREKTQCPFEELINYGIKNKYFLNDFLTNDKDYCKKRHLLDKNKNVNDNNNEI